MIADAWEVDNYPGIQKISGADLSLKLFEHAKSYRLRTLMKVVEGIRKEGEKFFISTKEREIEAKCVIIATGEKRKKLGVPGEDELLGKGVSYCAICDAPLFKDRVVAR
jgi:thioredoxin reductase (NADPH)